jgi:glucose/arabinose dehydrogenase
MRAAIDANGKVTAYEPFVQGWLQADRFWGRPADVLVMADGAMLVSDDYTGALFRVSYAGP